MTDKTAEHHSVNRYLKDRHFNRIDHALGRPLDPMAETYRNHYATDNDALAAKLRASDHWDNGTGKVGGMIFFHVTPLGRQALSDHLREIGSPHRLYQITWDGWTMTQVAKSPSAARYAKWLDLSDSYPELPFVEFLRTSRVRVAR